MDPATLDRAASPAQIGGRFKQASTRWSQTRTHAPPSTTTPWPSRPGSSSTPGWATPKELAELFGQGLPANLRNDKGDSLLMLAAYNGQAEATRVILEAGGDPELANDRGQTPLAGAAFKNDLAIARLLLQHGATVDGTGDGTRTALMTAAMFDRTEMVDLLLQHGADPDRRDAALAKAPPTWPGPWARRRRRVSSTGRRGRHGELSRDRPVLRCSARLQG